MAAASASASASRTSSPTNNTTEMLAAFSLADCSKQFAHTLRSMNAFISGGFALYWYMNHHNKTPVPFPAEMDMDIWIPGRSEDSAVNKSICLNSFDLLLGSLAGYMRQSNEERQKEALSRWRQSVYGKPTGEIDYMCSPSARLIQNIYNYIHPVTGRKIQLIFLNRWVSHHDLTSTFDLDICKFVVRFGDYDVDPNFLMVDAPVAFKGWKTDVILDRLMKQKVMSMTFDKLISPNVPNLLVRLEKYYGRGFAVEAAVPPCPCCKRPFEEKKRLSLDEAKELATNLMKASAAPVPAGVTSKL